MMVCLLRRNFAFVKFIKLSVTRSRFVVYTLYAFSTVALDFMIMFLTWAEPGFYG